MNNYEKILETINEDILDSGVDSELMKTISERISSLRKDRLNILITGATGAGKSSTINALFEKNVAKVGETADPETMHIEKYELDNLTLWDSPGLGDGKNADNLHAEALIKKLTEKADDGSALIDLVLVVIDGSSRDLGTSYELINNVIIPNMSAEDKAARILIGVNQCDAAMKGRHWISEENRPDEVLTAFLDEKTASIKARIKEATGVDTDPVYYSAGYTENGVQQRPYNLTKLLSAIIEHTPVRKRLVYISNVSHNENMWKDNDELKDYSREIQRSFIETMKDCIFGGSNLGRAIGGSLLGKTGEIIGTIAGGIIGGIGGMFISAMQGLFD